MLTDSPLLTKQQLAQIYNMSERTVQRLINRGLPCHRYVIKGRRKLLFKRNEVADYLESIGYAEIPPEIAEDIKSIS